MKEKDYIEVGQVIGTHGLQGELKIRPYTETPYDFENFYDLTVKGKTLRIRSCRIHAGKVFLTLERVTKRTTAEKLINELVFVNREQASQLEENEYYIVDLVGADVQTPDGKLIGTLVDVKQTGVVDNFEIKVEENKTILVPALNEYFEIIDETKIVADFPKEFFEL